MFVNIESLIFLKYTESLKRNKNVCINIYWKIQFFCNILNYFRHIGHCRVPQVVSRGGVNLYFNDTIQFFNNHLHTPPFFFFLLLLNFKK